MFDCQFLIRLSIYKIHVNTSGKRTKYLRYNRYFKDQLSSIINQILNNYLFACTILLTVYSNEYHISSINDRHICTFLSGTIIQLWIINNYVAFDLRPKNNWHTCIHTHKRLVDILFSKKVQVFSPFVYTFLLYRPAKQ